MNSTYQEEMYAVGLGKSNLHLCYYYFMQHFCDMNRNLGLTFETWIFFSAEILVSDSGGGLQ